MPRAFLLLATLSALPAFSCERTGGPPGGAARAGDIKDPYRLRVMGKLHAERDTKDGYREAAAFFHRLVELEPGSATDRLNLAKTLLFADDLAGCERELAEARRLFGEGDAPPDLHYVSGLLAKRQARFEDGLKLFELVIEKKPIHASSWFQRGALEEQVERYEAAEKSFRRVLELAPTHQAAAYRLSLVLRRLKRDEEAQRMLDLFRSIAASDVMETEKCDLTAVTLRPFERRAVEPVEAKLSFTDVTTKLLGASGRGMARAIPMRLGAEGRRGLLLAGTAGVRVLRLTNGLARPEDGALTQGGDGSFEVLAGAGDIDNDGLDDAVLATQAGLAIWHAGAAGGLLVRDGLPDISETVGKSLALYDADHDGDLDIILLLAKNGRTEATIFRNNGDLTFTRLSPFGELEVQPGILETRSHAFSGHDVDQANDIDFVFAGGRSGVQVFLNRRDGTFTRVVLPALKARTIVLVEDLNNDGAPDLFAAGGDPGWSCAMNADRIGSPYALRIETPQVVQNPRCGEVRDACAADIDNDGDLDVLLATSSGVALLRNVAGGTLREEQPVVIAGGPGARCVSAVDLDGDGVIEVLAAPDAGDMVVLAANPSPAYASVCVLPVGSRDNRDGVGAVVEVYAGLSYQSLFVREAGGVHVGLGPEGRKQLDGVRLRWPQGIVQSVPAAALGVDASGEARVRQKEGLVASCPFLFARSSAGWRFVTDILGIAPIDEWAPEGQTPRLDPEELVRVDSGFVTSIGGLLHFAVTEELRETAYLDRMDLITVEHPEDREVFIDESTRQENYGPLKLLVVPRNGLSPPASIVVEGERDAADAVRARDGKYVHGYPVTRPQWAGWVERYAVEMMTDTPARALLLTGRVAWYDSTVVYSLAQNGRSWGPLRLEWNRGTGFELVAEDLGVPSGMDRTMVCVFSRPPVPAGTRFRLSGQHRFLWDQILFAAEVEQVDPIDPIDPMDAGELGYVSGNGCERRLGDGAILRVDASAPLRGTLGYHGFSRVVGDAERHEARYSYDEAAPDGSFAPATGRATRYGDVTSLLRAHDDELVVLVTGDGVEVDFPAPAVPGAGRKLTYFLRISGWAKEGSFHNRTGRTIEPLPTRGMSRYPPPPTEEESSAAYRSYLRLYQTRDVRERER